MWVAFVFGSFPYSGTFFSRYSGFLLSSKATFLNSNSIWNLRATGLSVEILLSVALIKQSQLILFIYFKGLVGQLVLPTFYCQ